jgi:hypothetical protein
MATVLSLTASVKENDEMMSRKMQLVMMTIRDNETLKPLKDDPAYQQAVSQYHKEFDQLVKLALSDKVGLAECAGRVREYAVQLAKLIEESFAKLELKDVKFGLARVGIMAPVHPQTNGVI